jgi:hypothetical protein
LFAKLECNGDFAQAAQRLYSMGYGDRGKRQEKTRQPADALNDTPIEEVWEEILLKEEPPPDKPLITINNIPVVIAGEHTLIVGKKKSRKTLFVVWLISKYPALFFDTEQGRGHVWKVRQKVMQLSGKETPVFYLRGKSPSERREIIYQTVKQWPERPALIVIDGIRDLLSNINDPDQATNLIVWIEGLCREFGVAIVNVLHLNKTDGQARGHIGTELGNKAFMTVELALDEVSGASIVKCESSRDRPFESFAITHDPEGLPIITGMPIKGEVLTDKERRQRLAYVFEDGPLKYGETVDRISQHFNVGERKAKALLSEFRRCGWLVKSGPDRSPDTVYKLMITEGTSGSDHT